MASTTKQHFLLRSTTQLAKFFRTPVYLERTSHGLLFWTTNRAKARRFTDRQLHRLMDRCPMAAVDGKWVRAPREVAHG